MRSGQRPSSKVLRDCGASLNTPDGTPVTQTPPVQEREVAGERRHLTVLFCDLVGSTEISARLDPEEFRELLADYHRVATEAIVHFGGHVAKYLGRWRDGRTSDGLRRTRMTPNALCARTGDTRGDSRAQQSRREK